MIANLTPEGIVALDKELEAPPRPASATPPPPPSRGTKELMTVLRTIGAPNVGMRPAPKPSPEPAEMGPKE